MMVKKLAITQIVLAVLLIASYYYITWILLRSVPSIFNLYSHGIIPDYSGTTQLIVNNMTMLYFARAGVVLVFFISLFVLSCGIAQIVNSEKNTIKFAIVFLISGLIIAGFSYIVATFGFPLSFNFTGLGENVIGALNISTGIRPATLLSIFSILLGIGIFICGLYQILKTRIKQILTTENQMIV
ncbi:MAG: hypothetical protein JW967_05165 [Dehalococcoidales bacterium]|nr:hypothetical protein [Dehalococcoidales bacterium]